ncbi:MAG: GreA/GreB family elongation factor [Kofleriaceae bacterium]
MSKAFTKEDADIPEAPMRKRGVPVPVPNIVTPAGLAAIRAEHDELGRTGGDPDRMRELADHLATAQTVEPDRSTVGVGARVTVEDEDGKRTTYHIVGAIEADAKRGLVSWQSPIAQALWGLRVGDGVTLPRSEGEIVAIDYDPA